MDWGLLILAAAIIAPTDTPLNHSVQQLGVGICEPHRAVGTTCVLLHTPLWHLNTGVPQEHAIPAPKVDILVTVPYTPVVGGTPGVIQYRVVLAVVCTTRCSTNTDTVLSHWTLCVPTHKLDRVGVHVWAGVLD
jgi:hypothetical protein